MTRRRKENIDLTLISNRPQGISRSYRTNLYLFYVVYALQSRNALKFKFAWT